jgi:poly(hydroxyalkanoate) depolymerase family esterase
MNLKRIVISIAVMALVNTVAFGGSWAGGAVKTSAGSLEYKLWVPSAYSKKPVPLVLMLHGCMQKPEELAALSGMNELADKNNFLVAYPEQTVAANPLRCWNWFDPKHQSRDAGEASLIAAVIQDVRASHKVDAKRVFVVGISAGAAMAVVMGVAYPETFAGLGVIAGAEFRAATTVSAGLAVMKSGGPDPNEQGLLAFQEIQKSFGGSKKRMPVIAFQGMSDPYMSPLNTDQLIAQWAQTNDYLDDGKDNDSVSIRAAKETRGVVANGYSLSKYVYPDSSGRLLMEKWIVEGLGHAWPGSPIANQFADRKGPNATAEMWRFFAEANSNSRSRGGNK